jgi:3-oxoacyl-[acyl-carrier protein] reductase
LADQQPIPTYPDLRGKVAVVTGGSKGVGAEACRLLARQGTCVVVNGRDTQAIDKLVAEIAEDGGKAIGFAADCSDFAAVEAMRRHTESELGHADILVAYAGGFGAYTPVQLTDEVEWRRVIDSNLTSTFLTIKSFLPGMIERRRGSILTIASNSARTLDIPLTASYAASKGGVIVLTRHVAKEVGQYGIRANCIAPATILSDRIRNIMSEERRAEVAALSPLGRLGETLDVALATLFLASDSSSYLTGITLDVAGGRVMQ